MKRVMEGCAVGLMMLLWAQQALFASTTAAVVQEGSDCSFKSVFAFGDGMFDTGSISNVFPSVLNYDYPPYGSTYFKKPSGRFSDGRLVLDFISESLGLPKIPSYAQTVLADFSSGVSFASAFSTIGKVSTGQGAGPFIFLNPFSLGVQLTQFLEFKWTTGTVIEKATVANSKRALLEGDPEATGPILAAEQVAMARLPANKDFYEGLYLVSTGAHDIVNFYNLKKSFEFIEGKFSTLMKAYAITIRSFAKLNHVKNIVVFDVEPLGCQPFLLTLIPHTPKDLDEKGCLIAQNALVQKFNRLLKKEVQGWRARYNANIYFLSQYDIKIDMLKDAKAGFTSTNAACCGLPASPYNVVIPVPCGPPVFDPTTNATLQATACSEPSTHVYWDGFYTTEAVNKYVAEKIMSGYYFDIPFDALTSCATKPLT